MALGKTLLYVVYAVIVAGMVVAIGLSFHSSKTPVAKTPSSSGSHEQASGGKPPAASKPSPAPSASSSSGTSSSGQTGSTTTPSSASPQLNNAGPGNTIGLFIAVSAVGGLAYRRYLVVKRA